MSPSHRKLDPMFFLFDAIYDGDFGWKAYQNDLDVEFILRIGEKTKPRGFLTFWIWLRKGNLPTDGHNLACELMMSFAQNYCVHPRKLTWQWNITIFDKRYIFIPGLFSIVMLVLWGVYYGFARDSIRKPDGALKHVIFILFFTPTWSNDPI